MTAGEGTTRHTLYRDNHGYGLTTHVLVIPGVQAWYSRIYYTFKLELYTDHLLGRFVGGGRHLFLRMQKKAPLVMIVLMDARETELLNINILTSF